MKLICTLVVTLFGVISNAAPLRTDNFPKLSNGVYFSTKDQNCRKFIRSVELEESISILNMRGFGSCSEKSTFLCSSSKCISSNADQSRVLIVLSANTFFLSTADGSTLFISEYPFHR